MHHKELHVDVHFKRSSELCYIVGVTVCRNDLKACARFIIPHSALLKPALLCIEFVSHNTQSLLPPPPPPMKQFTPLGPPTSPTHK